jgi:peptidoglycan/xylan/chitin deacetylase (PgdA/CDA1 family)
VDGLAVVVFDDAFVGVHHHAAGVLADLAVPGTLFPLTTGLGSAPAWWSDAHRTMTLDETRELVAQGWEVGSHTRTHASLPDIDDRALHAEVADSRAELSEQLGVAPDLLAYPFGHHDARVREVTAESGYRAGFTFLNGRIVSGLDAYRLPRLTIPGALGATAGTSWHCRATGGPPDRRVQ